MLLGSPRHHRNWTTCLSLSCPSTRLKALYLNPPRPLRLHPSGATRSGSGIASRTARRQTPPSPPALLRPPQLRPQAHRMRGRQGTSSFTQMLLPERQRASPRNLRLRRRGVDTGQRSGQRGGTGQNRRPLCGEM